MEEAVAANNQGNKNSIRQLFGNINFSLLFFGRLVSQLGDAVYGLAIGWFILDLTGSGTQMGAYMAVGLLVYIIAGPIGGVISDKVSRVKLIYLTDYIRGIAVVLSGIIVYLNISVTVTLITLYCANIIIRLCSTVFNPASSAVLPSIVTEEQLTKANSMNNMIFSMANIVGVVAGGVLYAMVGIFGIFIINAVSYILSGFSEMFIKISEKINESDDTDNQLNKYLTDLKEGFVYVYKSRGLMTIIVIAFFLNFLFNPLFAVFVPYIFNQVLKTGVVELSYIEVAGSIGMIMGSIIISAWKKELKCRKTLTIGSSVLLPFFILFTVLLQLRLTTNMAHSHFLIYLFIIMALIGLPLTFINIPISVALQKMVPSELLGRVMSMLSTLVMAAMPLGLILGGIIVDTMPIVPAIIVIDVLFLLTIIGIWINKKHINF